MDGLNKSGYLKTLQERAAKRNITQEFQLIGLEIAVVLHDLEHKSIYIKYAKAYGSDKMLALAKDIASRRGVENPAGYFMTVVSNEFNITKIRK